MNTVAITIDIPMDLAQEADEFGLLQPNALIDVLRLEVNRQVMALVNAEIQAHRKEKRINANKATLPQ